MRKNKFRFRHSSGGTPRNCTTPHFEFQQSEPTPLSSGHLPKTCQCSALALSLSLSLSLSLVLTTHTYAGNNTVQPVNNWQPLLADIADLASMELAKTLQQAYNAQIVQARPLPPEVKTFLRGIIPDTVIERARFTVSNDSTTLPGLLNQGHRAYMAQDNAVSIDNLIIFSREPTFSKSTDARWWAHELGHHIQYQQLGGIAGFARRYVLDFQTLENDAEKYGEQALRKYIDLQK